MQVAGERNIDDTFDALLSEIDENDEKQKEPEDLVAPVVDLYLDNIGVIRKQSDEQKHSLKSLRGKEKGLPPLLDVTAEHQMVDPKDPGTELALELQRTFVDYNRGKKLKFPMTKRITKVDIEVISAHIKQGRELTG